MKKIDSYILRKFITTVIFCLAIFVVIIVVVDLSERTDDFVKYNLSAREIFFDYYLGFVPRLMSTLFPLIIFLSVIFFTSKMASRSEVIAILSSGVSFLRYMFPFMLGAFLFGGIMWYASQYIIPVANKTWGDFDKKYLSNRPTVNSNERGSYKTNLYFNVDANTTAGLRGYDTVTKSGNIFFLQKFSANKLIYNLRASTIRWDTTSSRWILNAVVERTIDSIGERIVNSYEKSINYNFKPIDLRTDNYLKDQMPTKELNRFIQSEKNRGQANVNALLVERYNRDSIPASCIILTIIGVAIASRKVRGGSGMHIAIGVVICVLYILFSRVSIVFATQGDFPPLLAAWMPNIIFGALSFYLYRKAPK